MTIATRPASATTAAPTGLAARRRSSQRLPDAGNTRSWWIMALMVSAFSFCMLMQFRQSPYELSSKPIDAICLGDNVPGVNPEGDANEQPVIREQWRKITLRAHQTADNRLIEMELLRPVSWIEENSTDDGENVFVQFDELHFRGQAKIEAIEECPETRTGPGRTVTGFFRHYASHVIDLKTDNGESIGVTPEHPFWSVDRQSFVDARTLKPGDRLKLLEGQTTTVTQATKRPSSEPVYNLEIQSSHVYHVAESGLLVHNSGGLPCNISPSGERVVYRELNAADRARLDQGLGLLPHGTGGSIADQVVGNPTSYISGSETIAGTARFRGGNGLAAIDVNKAIKGGSGFVDHKNVLQAVGRDGLPRNVQNAERASEVLFKDLIPFDAIRIID